MKASDEEIIKMILAVTFPARAGVERMRKASDGLISNVTFPARAGVERHPLR